MHHRFVPPEGFFPHFQSIHVLASISCAGISWAASRPTSYRWVFLSVTDTTALLVTSAIEKHGWSYDSSTQVLTPSRVSEQSSLSIGSFSEHGRGTCIFVDADLLLSTHTIEHTWSHHWERSSSWGMRVRSHIIIHCKDIAPKLPFCPSHKRFYCPNKKSILFKLLKLHTNESSRLESHVRR